MPKYVRFERDEDVEWLRGLMERAVQKLRDDTSKLTEENAIIVPRVLDALVSAADVEHAEAIGVPKKVVREDKKIVAAEEKEKKARRKKKPKPVKYDLCPKHPRNAMKKRPSTDCEGCWAAYKKMNPMNYEKARRDFERKQTSG